MTSWRVYAIRNATYVNLNSAILIIGGAQNNLFDCPCKNTFILIWPAPGFPGEFIISWARWACYRHKGYIGYLNSSQHLLLDKDQVFTKVRKWTGGVSEALGSLFSPPRFFFAGVDFSMGREYFTGWKAVFYSYHDSPPLIPNRRRSSFFEILEIAPIV